ncbi:hypothetical protein C8Q75DRAFT_293698 [Abortiporus biennis]|nr:hypothetical protein C8Q75DRAFT_293698 [Abortiporus biennis]
MSLQPGKYYISSMAVNGGRKISRYWVEDMSLHPKRVILLPEDSKVPDHWKPEWIIEKSDDSDSYIMKSRHSYTVNHNGNLLAILSPDFAPPQTWKITPQPMHGSNIYTIEAIDSSVG